MDNSRKLVLLLCQRTEVDTLKSMVLWGNQEAMGRKSESLRQFSSQPSDVITWSERYMDHMARVHQVWRPTLRWMAKTEEPLTMNRLRNETMGPYNETLATRL